MTNEELITICKAWRDRSIELTNKGIVDGAEDVEIYDAIIEALGTQNSKLVASITIKGEDLQDIVDAVRKELVCEDCISREALRQKLEEHHDFFVNAYGNFRGMSLNDKTRVDEIDNCIAMVVNAPSVTPQQKATGSWVEKQVVDNEEVEIEQWQSARCSKCDKYHTTPYAYFFYDYNYCPICGAKMEVDE